MSFRPRFRLSLLFVFIALVAGVSVWLRQAVVRDHNIRAFISEDFVGGGVDSEDHYLNTKILNLFCSKDRYYDRLFELQLSIHKINLPEAIQKYQNCDLGGELDVLFLQAWQREEPESVTENKIHTISLSQIQFWTNRFHKIDKLVIEGVTIVDDVEEAMPCQAKVQKISFRLATIDPTSLQKLLRALQIFPHDLDFNSNWVNSKFSDIRELGIFDKAQLEYLENHNSFHEPDSKAK